MMTPQEEAREVDFVRGEAERLEFQARRFVGTLEGSFRLFKDEYGASDAVERQYRRRVAAAEQFADMCAEMAPKGENTP